MRDDGALLPCNVDIDAVFRLRENVSPVSQQPIYAPSPPIKPAKNTSTTHLRYPALHQKQLETHGRGARFRRTAPGPVLLHVHPLAKVVFDYEDGFWFAGEIGGDL